MLRTEKGKRPNQVAEKMQQKRTAARDEAKIKWSLGKKAGKVQGKCMACRLLLIF